MKRYGRFSIDRDLIVNAIDNNIDIKSLQELQSNFFIVKAEMDFYKDQIYYIAYSPLFDVIPDGTVAPEYILDIEQVFYEDAPSKVKLNKVTRYEQDYSRISRE